MRCVGSLVLCWVACALCGVAMAGVRGRRGGGST